MILILIHNATLTCTATYIDVKIRKLVVISCQKLLDLICDHYDCYGRSVNDYIDRKMDEIKPQKVPCLKNDYFLSINYFK